MDEESEIGDEFGDRMLNGVKEDIEDKVSDIGDDKMCDDDDEAEVEKAMRKSCV